VSTHFVVLRLTARINGLARVTSLLDNGGRLLLCCRTAAVRLRLGVHQPLANLKENGGHDAWVESKMRLDRRTWGM